VGKITTIQVQISQMNDPANSLYSLEYFLTLSSDLAKLIRRILKHSKISRESLSSLLRASSLSPSLAEMCF